MQSLVHAYQAYEQRVLKGELGENPAPQTLKPARFMRLPFTYRLGEGLVRIGTKLKNRTRAGHTLAAGTMARH